jgi:hypothetical protein
MSVDERMPVASGPAATSGGSPVWVGLVAFLLMLVGAAWMVVYAVFDIQWQMQFGGWNLIGGAGLMCSSVIPLRLWRPDRRYPIKG